MKKPLSNTAMIHLAINQGGLNYERIIQKVGKHIRKS